MYDEYVKNCDLVSIRNDEYFDNMCILYADCYLDGVWNKDIPFVSICERKDCCAIINNIPSRYCSGLLPDTCYNRIRDEMFNIQYKWDTDTNYYPSDCDEAFYYIDRKVIRLCELPSRGEGKILSGQEIFDIIENELLDAYHGEENWSYYDSRKQILNWLRSNNYDVSDDYFMNTLKHLVIKIHLEELFEILGTDD